MVDQRVVSSTVPATGIVRCILSGKPTLGDQLFFHWCDARGGRSSASAVIGQGHSLEDLAQMMIRQAAGLPEAAFVLASKGSIITCIVKPSCPAGTFCTETIGSGTVKLTLEE